MVSKIACTSKQNAVQYFEAHLSAGDYFIGVDGAKQGVWFGELAAKVGTDGAGVTKADFENWLDGDLTGIGGEGRQSELKRVRASELRYIEFTYTAPKGFSVAAALDERLKAELESAVKDELKWFEAAAGVRDRRGDLTNLEVVRPTSNFMAALFAHETSRTNDPNMHIHALIGNMSFDAGRAELLALHFGDMFELRKTLDARIHNNLASRTAALGYHIEIAPNGFGLREIPAEAVELFSTRHRQVANAARLLREGYTVKQLKAVIVTLTTAGDPYGIESYAKMKEILGKPLGLPMADHAIEEAAVLVTRPPKIDIDSQTLRSNTQGKLEAAGITVTIPAAGVSAAVETLGIDQAVSRASERCFEKDSIVRLDELIGEIARLSPGVFSNLQIADKLRRDPRFILGRMATEERPGGVDLVTTAQLVAEENQLLQDVLAGRGSRTPIARSYQTPESLRATPQRVAEIMADATRRGEELTGTQITQWLTQFQSIHEYAVTSPDQFLNIRGGAGVGKTFALELLVGESLAAGRQVIVCAPYGEQSRVNLRPEADRLAASGRTAEAEVFSQANTVVHLLVKARINPEFRETLRGADIYVDEAGLLDSPTAAALARLARCTGSRVIFQGDVEQKQAVGRGAPLTALQERIGLGMHVGRASISRRQLRSEDKRLAEDLSSGDQTRFEAALSRYVERGDVREIPCPEAISEAASLLLDARANKRDLLVFSSVHRIGEGISEELHQQRLAADPTLECVLVDTLRSLDLATVELNSSQFYRPGQTVHHRRGSSLRESMVESVKGGVVRVKAGKQTEKLNLAHVTDIFERSTVERTIGATMILTEKVQSGRHTHEKNSRHRIETISGDQLCFDSGLRLHRSDGRLRQGDVLTTDKAQGAKGREVLWVEDSRSLVAMADRRTAHVGFTRHVEKLAVLVENVELFKQAAGRGRPKISALDFTEKSTPSTVWQPVEERRRKLPSPLPSSISPKTSTRANAWQIIRSSARWFAEQIRLHPRTPTYESSHRRTIRKF